MLTVKQYCTPLFKLLLPLCLALSLSTGAKAQLDTNNVQHAFGWLLNFGASELLTLRPQFDSWTFNNYKVTEVQWPNFYAGGDILYDRFKLGVDVNIKSAFHGMSAGIGFRITKPESVIASWIQIDYGELDGNFYNIRPLQYHPTADEAGQKLYLAYAPNYIGITTKNYLNFLHFNIGNTDSGQGADAINVGFFCSAFYLTGQQYWRYGYDDKSGKFQSVNIYDVPTLSRWQISAGVFITFLGFRFM